MLRTIVLCAVLAVAGTAFALSGGIAPCYEEDGKVTCMTDRYIPLWDVVPAPGPQPVPDKPPAPVVRPSKANADYDSCKRCHKKRVRWKAKLHREHKEEGVSCNRCHSL